MSKENTLLETHRFLEFSYKQLSNLLDSSFHIRIFEEDRRKEIDALLYDRSLIVPFNHPSVFDPIAVARELRTSFPNVPRILLPASMKFYDGRMGKPAKTGMDYFAEKYGIEMIPVIQHYDDTYTDSEKRKNYTELFSTACNALKDPGNIVMIAPEGTRSTNCQMGKAQAGIAKMMQKCPDSMVCPVSVYGTEGVMGTSQYIVNPFLAGNLVYGKPIEASEVLCNAKEIGIPAQDLVMYQIAQHVPERYRGYYSD